jgi:hypothetical protein
MACVSTTPYNWCSCLPYVSGILYKTQESDDFVQTVYV